MTSEPKEARNFIVGGRVQGVGFRYFVQREAQGLGLAGWVRNLPDGRVEAFIEGPAADLDEIEKLLRRGPALSRVESLDISPAAPSLATDFVIRG